MRLICGGGMFAFIAWLMARASCWLRLVSSLSAASPSQSLTAARMPLVCFCNAAAPVINADTFSSSFIFQLTYSRMSG